MGLSQNSHPSTANHHTFPPYVTLPHEDSQLHATCALYRLLSPLLSHLSCSACCCTLSACCWLVGCGGSGRPSAADGFSFFSSLLTLSSLRRGAELELDKLDFQLLAASYLACCFLITCHTHACNMHVTQIAMQVNNKYLLCTESAYRVPLRRKCIELESTVCAQYSAVKGKSGVIALSYCVHLSYIFMLILHWEGLLIL